MIATGCFVIISLILDSMLDKQGKFKIRVAISSGILGTMAVRTLILSKLLQRQPNLENINKPALYGMAVLFPLHTNFLEELCQSMVLKPPVTNLEDDKYHLLQKESEEEDEST